MEPLTDFEIDPQKERKRFIFVRLINITENQVLALHNHLCKERKQNQKPYFFHPILKMYWKFVKMENRDSMEICLYYKGPELPERLKARFNEDFSDITVDTISCISEDFSKERLGKWIGEVQYSGSFDEKSWPTQETSENLISKSFMNFRDAKSSSLPAIEPEPIINNNNNENPLPNPDAEKIRKRKLRFFTDETELMFFFKIGDPTTGDYDDVSLEINNTDRLENEIQQFVASDLNGEENINLRYCGKIIGKIDVLSDEYVCEIKKWENWMKAMGQVIAYSKRYPNRKRLIHFFGPYLSLTRVIYIYKMLKAENILMSYEGYE